MLPLLPLALAACGPAPPIWPAQFIIEQKKIPDDGSGNSSVTTYYDSVQGANLLLIAPESNKSDVLWDLELNTKHSYYFTPTRRTCTAMSFPVGILARDWLRNATYLGIKQCPFAPAGRRCAAWTKVQFIDYYADIDACEPAAWYFWTMKAMFVTSAFTEGATAPAGYFAAPSYCNTTVTADH